MSFKKFFSQMKNHMDKMIKDRQHLYVVDVDKDVLWETYLDSFPEGTNEIFIERREHDCSYCRGFVRNFGNVVAIADRRIVSIWDFDAKSDVYQPVVDTLNTLIVSSKITDVFVTNEKSFGVEKNREILEDGRVRVWSHFHVSLPKDLVNQTSKTVGSVKGELRSTKEVFQRSLEEISVEAVETVLDLVSQKSLYKGEEWAAVLRQFQRMQRDYLRLKTSTRKDLYCWNLSVQLGGAITRIRNHSIGVLLTDISEGMELDSAVRRYEAIVAPENYKRPKAIFTKKMVKQAQKTIEDLGLLDSLGRRFAVLPDISINNVLFANRDAAQKMSGDVFDDLMKEVPENPKNLSNVAEMPIEHFVSEVLPRVSNIEILLENKLEPNMVSLVAPENPDAKSMFKWDNGFSWAYNGNITDSSMRKRVKAAGGNIDAVLRFSIQWNEENDNQDDYDAHCIEPNGNRIHFPNKGMQHPSSGMLDVDIVHPKNDVAVENITWVDENRMKEGVYHLLVNNYTHRGGQSGFRAEIEYNGQIHSFEYNKALKHGENVTVAKVKYTKEDGIEFLESLDKTTSSKEIWGLKTNQFCPVSVFLFSPNHWDELGIGHRHYFFMLRDCINDTGPNGFFNEFLREDLMEHKRVFEALGSKMRVSDSTAQLSGIGFSSTKRGYVICKVTGHISRMIKVLF